MSWQNPPLHADAAGKKMGLRFWGISSQLQFEWRLRILLKEWFIRCVLDWTWKLQSVPFYMKKFTPSWRSPLQIFSKVSNQNFGKCPQTQVGSQPQPQAVSFETWDMIGIWNFRRLRSMTWISSVGCAATVGWSKNDPQKNLRMKFKAPKNSGFPWFFFTEKIGVAEKNDIMIIMMFVSFCSSLGWFPCVEVILQALVGKQD